MGWSKRLQIYCDVAQQWQNPLSVVRVTDPGISPLRKEPPKLADVRLFTVSVYVNDFEASIFSLCQLKA